RAVLHPGAAAAAIRRRAAGAAPDGLRGLLPRDRRAARQGTLLRSEGHGVGAAGRDRQRGAGAPAVADRGSDRQVADVADLGGRAPGTVAAAAALDLPGGWRGGEREELDAGARRRAGDFLYAAAVPVPRPGHRRPGPRGSRGAGRGGAVFGAAARPEPADRLG